MIHDVAEDNASLGLVKSGPGSFEPKEGWLQKKCHHIGLWKYRFFRFDGKVLRYWKRKYQAESEQPPRGEFHLTRCPAFPVQDQRLLLRAPERAFDEELYAASSEERNAWVRLLNSAALQHRLSVISVQVSTERFLRCHGLWEPLENAVYSVADVAATPTTLATLTLGSEARCSTMASAASTTCGGEDAVLQHVHFGSVLLQISDQPLAARQGRFVVAGRRALQNMRRKGGDDTQSVETDRSESWVLLASLRSLAANAPAGPLSGADAFYKTMEEQLPPGGTGGVPLLEALHAYVEPLDEAPPFASLPLAHCWVSAEEECLDGSGWSLYVENKAECDGRPCAWTLILGTREECSRWRRAIETAIWAARAHEAGRLRLEEEALRLFDGKPGAWRGALARRLADVAADAPARRTAHPSAGAWATRSVAAEDVRSLLSQDQRAQLPHATRGIEEGSGSLRRVLVACREVCEDAGDMLDAALAQTPLRRDICEVALEAAIDPAIESAGRCWSHFSPALSHDDGRALLRWLDEQRRANHRRGLLHTPLDAAVSGLAVELSLRDGARLRSIVQQLLVREFGEAMRARVPQGLGGGQAAVGSGSGGSAPSRRPSEDVGVCASQLPPFAALEEAHSTLPVDLFTMVFTCLPFDRDQEVLALRLSSQRVAKFVVFELQKAIWEWLVATLPEVHREIRSKTPFGGGLDLGFPQRAVQWLACISALANAAPALSSQCRELGAVPLRAGDDGSARPSELVRTFAAPDGSELGSETLPAEWGLAAEEQRFEALQEAVLWAACDLASARWRRMALSSADLPADAAGLGIGDLLKSQLEVPARLLRGWLEPSAFRRLLQKLFHLCLAGYIVRLSRGLWFQSPLVGEPTEMAFFQLSEDTQQFCRYFQALAGTGTTVSDSDPWEPGRVLTSLHAVLASPTAYQKWRPATAPKSQQPLSGDAQGIHKDGLGYLVAALSEGPLPLQDVMAWFGAKPPLDPFDELPPATPLGGQLVTGLFGSPCPSRRSSTPAIGRLPSQDSLGSKQVGSPERRSPRKRMTMPTFSVFGKVPEQFKDPKPAEPSLRAGGVELIEEGKVCDLEVQEVGAYGAFCGILRQLEELPSSGASFLSGASGSLECGPRRALVRPRRRWAQLVRHAAGRAPLFQVLSSMPEGLQDPGEQVLLSLPLSQLTDALPRGASDLTLVFRDDSGPCDTSIGTFVCRPPIRYHINFDCPSHLFRWRLVLEAWTSLTIPPLQPIVSLGTKSASSWDDLPQQLSHEVLEQRLGSLWADVRKDLQAGGAARRSRGPTS